MPVNPLGYPLDLTGVAPSNLITNEHHVFNTAPERVFVPSGGPFYTIGMAIRHGVTNVLLQPNTQYKLLHLHKDGSLLSRKEVCAVVYITDTNIPSVNLEYQLLGGVYADTADNIRTLMLANPVDDTVSWGHIFGQPVQFTPAEHLHHVSELYGMAQAVDVLERLRVAVVAGDSPAIDAIYQYLHTLITNADYTSVNDVIALIGNTPFVQIQTYATYAELRAVNNMVNNTSSIHVATGKAALTDRKGRIFVWDITSMEPDDNDLVVRPNHIPDTNPGRFLSIMQVEANLRDALTTLGRRVEHNGTINANLGEVNRIESTDINTLITPGDYWIHSNCTNRPTNLETMNLRVWRESATAIGQTAQCLYSTNSYPHNRQGITYSRSSLNGGATWSAWHESFTVARAIANGIDTDLAVTNGTTADLNTLVRTGKYWFGDANGNAPAGISWAQLEVVCLNSTDVMQRAFNIYLEAYRYGHTGVNYAGHTWTAWEFRAARNGDTNQPFNMLSLDPVDIQPRHGINAAYLSTAFAALWSRLTANGIDANLGNTNAIGPGVSLNGVVAVGKYFYGDTNGGPFPWSILEVEAINSTNVIQTAYDAHRRAARHTYDSGANWTEWVFHKHLNIWDEANLNGGDLDWALTPGDYHFTPTTNGRPPASYGLVHVWRESSTIVYQQAQSADNRSFTRYRDGTGAWHPWATLSATESNGIVRVAATTISGDIDGSIQLPDYCRSVFIAVNAAGGRAGATGSNGGQGGGGAAGGYLRVSIKGDLGGCIIEYHIQSVNGSVAVPGYNTFGTGATTNPQSWLKIKLPNSSQYTALFTIPTGGSGGNGHGEHDGSGVSWGGPKGVSGGSVQHRLASNRDLHYDIYSLGGGDGTDGVFNVGQNDWTQTGHGGEQGQGADQFALVNPGNYGNGGAAGPNNTPGQQGGYGYLYIANP